VSAEGYAARWAAEDAWTLADRAIALAERSCTRMMRPGAGRSVHTTARRATFVALTLYYRAEAAQREADRAEENTP
jgi:hypothetical protein